MKEHYTCKELILIFQIHNVQYVLDLSYCLKIQSILSQITFLNKRHRDEFAQLWAVIFLTNHNIPLCLYSEVWSLGQQCAFRDEQSMLSVAEFKRLEVAFLTCCLASARQSRKGVLSPVEYSLENCAPCNLFFITTDPEGTKLLFNTSVCLCKLSCWTDSLTVLL